MVMMIFLLLDGLGVIFLLNVLGGFWKEGRRHLSHNRESVAGFSAPDGVSIFVTTEPISGELTARSSVIPFPKPAPEPVEQRFRRRPARQVSELAAPRFSTR